MNNYNVEINGITISEITNTEIVAVAIRRENELKVESLFKSLLKSALPKAGQAVVIDTLRLKVLRISFDQLFLFFAPEVKKRVETILSRMENSIYVTEQSDNWSGLKLSGCKAELCLERICPVDISIESFGVNSFARTIMEHLGVIIMRVDENEFELFSASSSANSFLNSLTTSARNA